MNSTSQQETNTSVCLDSSPRRPRLRNPHAGLLAAAHFTEADEVSCCVCPTVWSIFVKLLIAKPKKKMVENSKLPI